MELWIFMPLYLLSSEPLSISKGLMVRNHVIIFLVVFVTSWAPFLYIELSFTLLINKYAWKYPYETTEMEQQSNKWFCSSFQWQKRFFMPTTSCVRFSSIYGLARMKNWSTNWYPRLIVSSMNIFHDCELFIQFLYMPFSHWSLKPAQTNPGL